jgi:hypothetical protein
VGDIVAIWIIAIAIAGIVGLVWGVVAAFQRSTGWGLIALFFAPAGVIAFLVLTWRENYRPLALIGGALLLGIITVLAVGAQLGVM